MHSIKLVADEHQPTTDYFQFVAPIALLQQLREDRRRLEVCCAIGS